MNILNKTVRHRTYGEGTICSFEDNVVAVRFGTAVKKFIYPDAFKDYLTITESESRQYIEKKLLELEEENRLKREQEEKEAELKRLYNALPLDDSAQAAFAFMENDRQQTMKDWTVSLGKYRTGYNKGQPRIPTRMYPNSACILTYREKSEAEEERRIWAVFMVREDFIGPDCKDGIIKAHEKYRICLSEAEADKLRFWDYFKEEGTVPKWGLIEHKYVSNQITSDILCDILELKSGTEEQDLCREFLKYYCGLNKINRPELKEEEEEA